MRIVADHQLTKIVVNILQNRILYVSLEWEKSRWRIQKNGLAQGTVLAPARFTRYTNNQPLPDQNTHFTYYVDLELSA